MTSQQPVLDERIRAMLVRRAGRAMPSDLLAGIVRDAAATPQRRAAWGLGLPRSRSLGQLAPAALAIALVIAGLGLALRPAVGPTPSPSPTPAPSPSARPTALPTPAPTPRATVLGDVAAQVLPLGASSGPISVTYAFGSIWTANLAINSVSRIDPTTFRETARIRGLHGPAWFAVADGALWVTNQGGQALSRIDPATNTVVTTVQGPAPCGAPVVVLDSIWQAACDSNEILRIDPVANRVIATLPASQHTGLVLVGTDIYASGPNGLGRMDPATGAFTDVGGCCGFAIAAGAGSVWLTDPGNLVRVDPTNGAILASFKLIGDKAVAFGPGRAWVTVPNVGVLEIDLATNAIRRTIPVLPAPLVPLEADGALWITDTGLGQLWRLEP